VRAGFAYSPRSGPLGRARPWVAALYLAPLAVVAFTFANPLVLGAAGVAAYLAGALSGAGPAIRTPLRWSVGLAVMVIVVNALVSQRGATIIWRFGELPVAGDLDISLEAAVEGAVLALRIIVSLLVFAVWSACVDPDRVLRAIRPFASRSALTATLVSRLVPLSAADGTRMAEAARMRGPGAAPIGRAAIARRLVAGALDRSVDIAATLELRGYGLGRHSRRGSAPRERGEFLLTAVGVGELALVAAAGLAGVGGFDAYPTIAIDLDPRTFLLAGALPALSVVPFLAFRRLRPPYPTTFPRGGRRPDG
jgi:energy-coupling factor transport system permease protein